MDLRSTQPLTEMSTRILLGGRGRPARKTDLTAICEPTVYKMWDPRRLTTLCASTACYRDSYTFKLYTNCIHRRLYLNMDCNMVSTTYKVRLSIIIIMLQRHVSEVGFQNYIASIVGTTLRHWRSVITRKLLQCIFNICACCIHTPVGNSNIHREFSFVRLPAQDRFVEEMGFTRFRS
jgi:hypothetical protein